MIKLVKETRFGRLTVIERTDSKDQWNRCYLWKCMCDCGNEILVSGNRLKSGNVKSCGCLQKESRKINVAGQKFGRLTVVRDTGKIDDGSEVWIFRCDCGNEVEARIKSVKWGYKQSCGCLLQETKETQAKAARAATFVFNTNIGRIKAKQAQKNNPTGVRGVSFKAGINRYIARIQFQKKNYELGQFKTLEEATIVRREAEEQYFENFLHWYYEKFPDKKK